MESQQLTVMKTDDNSHNEDDDDYSRIVVVFCFAFYLLSLRWLTESLNWNAASLATKSSQPQLHENLPTLANALDYECSRSQPTPHTPLRWQPLLLGTPLDQGQTCIRNKNLTFACT